MEQLDAPKLKSWVAAEHAFTAKRLGAFEGRDWVHDRLTAFQDVPWQSVPDVAGGGVALPLYVAGPRATSPVLTAVVAMMEPATAALFGLAVLGAALSAMQITGRALIIATVTRLSMEPTQG